MSTIMSKMSTLTPSKYCSLKYLYLIKEQYYCSPETGKDYNPGEVDALIIEKEEKIIQKKIKQQLEERELEK